MNLKPICEQLAQTGLSVVKNFLSAKSISEVRADFALIQKAHGFHRAGTGQGDGNDVRNLVRRDEVHWIERSTPTTAQTMLWSKLDPLITAFNHNLYLGLSELNGHYAAYPAGGFYKRHLDCFQEKTGAEARVVSLVLYLNDAWKPSDGGQLRVYNSSSDASAFTDVEPVGGTLVCFLSKESEHEVLLSHAPRLSFTGWFKRGSQQKGSQ